MRGSFAEYQDYLKEKNERHEFLCGRCGKCCGSEDDPCTNLVKEGDKYACRVYGNHHGKQYTVSGKEFTCVSIREHIKHGSLRSGCSYSGG